MANEWFSPFHFSDYGLPGVPDEFEQIPDERIAEPDGSYVYAFTRGGMSIAHTQLGGNVWLMQAERPMKAIGPSVLFIEVHTVGVKCRSLSQENEKACWALIIEDNSFWVSARSNNGVRQCAAGADITEFYPDGLDYKNV